MSTATARLGLVKPIGEEFFSVGVDNGNNDKIDSAVGFEECTSSTRPSLPFNGKGIRESDTGSLLYSNGSSPPSGSWKYIWTPDGPVIVGAVGTAAPLRGRTTSTLAGNRFLDARKDGESQPGYSLDFDGKQQWGPGGSTAPDTNLYRSGADLLATDDHFLVGGNLGVGGSLTVTGNGLFKPWGGVIATPASLGTTSGGTELQLSNLSLSASGRTITANRYYKLCLQVEANATTANDQFGFRIRHTTAGSGTQIAELRWQVGNVSAFTDTRSFAIPWKAPSTLSNAKFFVSVIRNAGSGTMEVFGASRSAFWIEDGGSDTAVWSTS